MSKNIEVSVGETGEVAIISIKGDVTATSGESIEQAYQKISGGGTRKILLHFDGEGYINSGGIAILIGIASESKKRAQLVRITGLSAHFQKIFHMVGLTKYAEVFQSEESALKDF